MRETRKLAAILVSDVAGEDRTLVRLRTLRSDLIEPIISVHHGRVVKRTGDGSIIEFSSVVDAVRCAVEVQTAMIERNAGVPPEKRIEFRVGVHLGDVVEESHGDLMGDGVNVTARLEGVCGPGGVSGDERLSGQVAPRYQFETSFKRLKCANTGHCPRVRLVGQIDPVLPFEVGPTKQSVCARKRSSAEGPTG